MFKLDIKVEAGTVITGLRLLGEAIPGVTDKQAQKYGEEAIRAAPNYPPPPSNAYQRTGTYGRSFSLTGSPFKGGMRLATDAVDPYGRRYSSLVGGDAAGLGQWWRHKRTGWSVFFQEALKAAEKMITGIEAEITSVIRGVGL